MGSYCELFGQYLQGFFVRAFGQRRDRFQGTAGFCRRRAADFSKGLDERAHVAIMSWYYGRQATASRGHGLASNRLLSKVRLEVFRVFFVTE